MSNINIRKEIVRDAQFVLVWVPLLATILINLITISTLNLIIILPSLILLVFGIAGVVNIERITKKFAQNSVDELNKELRRLMKTSYNKLLIVLAFLSGNFFLILFAACYWSKLLEASIPERISKIPANKIAKLSDGELISRAIEFEFLDDEFYLDDEKERINEVLYVISKLDSEASNYDKAFSEALHHLEVMNKIVTERKEFFEKVEMKARNEKNSDLLKELEEI